MARRNEWSLAIVGALAAAVIGACSASGKGNDTSNSTGNGGTSTATSGPGSTSMSANSTVGVGGLTGAVTAATSSSTGNPSGMCDPTSCMAANGTCANNTCTIVENPGNVDPGTQKNLDGGGTTDSGFQWLYPYDQTVFPRGLIPPTMQFNGTAAEAFKVHITFPGMDYTGYFGGMASLQVKLPDASWTAVTLAAAANSDVQVDVTKSSGGQVTGPVTEHWTIAQGSLRGTIYYETYGSQILGGAASVGIMRIDPGAPMPTPVKSQCGNVCHTASADGSTLVANTQLFPGSASYDLKNNAAVIAAPASQVFTYGGIYPDGSFVVSATNYRTWFMQPSHLYKTSDGSNIPCSSFDGVVTNAAMPAFSPDGKFFTFNHEDTGGGRSLAVMKYDHTSNTFSGLADIVTDPNNYLGWPAFTPDSKWVVYHAGDNSEFETDGGAHGDLFFVDLATQTAARLDALDGYRNGMTYLPANDPDMNFAPTVLPEAVGGYFWVVFTSHRSYGNTLPSMDNGDQNGKLWVAALDLNPTPGKDGSHPAFFLDGQEYGADNLRGFWVLPPCKNDGNTCSAGDECCGGFCTNGMCTTNNGGCSQTLDKCSTAADCCDTEDECINGHCASPPPK